MAHRVEVGTVYAAGLFQGIALVTFPAAGGILTSPDYYGLSASQYGALFLPQAVLAVAAAVAGAGLARRLPTRLLLLGGLVANALAMALLLASQQAEGASAAMPILLTATALLGLGFGLTVPALNTFAAAFFPAHVDRAILVLNALLGLGTALAPALVAVFTAIGAWWGLPLTTLVALAATTVLVAVLPLRTTLTRPTAAGARTGIPARFWLFAAAALVYGIVETLNGNWATIYVGTDLGASATVASLALTAFWGMVTVGRLLFAGVERWIPDRTAYRLLPFLIAAALLWLSRLTSGQGAVAVVAFGLAGLGCSAMLPLTISFGQAELTAIGASVAGGVIAAYQVGYGIAAYAVGPAVSAGATLSVVLLVGTVVALGLAALSSGVVAGRKVEAHGNG